MCYGGALEDGSRHGEVGAGVCEREVAVDDTSAGARDLMRGRRRLCACAYACVRVRVLYGELLRDRNFYARIDTGMSVRAYGRWRIRSFVRAYSDGCRNFDSIVQAQAWSLEGGRIDVLVIVTDDPQVSAAIRDPKYALQYKPSISLYLFEVGSEFEGELGVEVLAATLLLSRAGHLIGVFTSPELDPISFDPLLRIFTHTHAQTGL